MKRYSQNTGSLQWIDRRLGVPVCLVLTWLRRVTGWFRRERPDAPARSILFLKLAEQGSTVLACEAIREAVERVGRDHVYFLVFEENRFIVDLLRLIPEENVLTVQTGSLWSMATSGLGRLWEIRRRGIDACIDMEFFARSSAAISYLTGTRVRVGFHTYFGEGPYRGDLFTHRVLYNPHLHTSRNFTSLLLSLDADLAKLPAIDVVPPPSPPLPPFQFTPEERAAMQQLIRDLGVPANGRLILLNANAGDLVPLRKWDGKNYVQLAQRLLGEFPELHIGFTGGPDERESIAALAQTVGSPRCLCLAGRTTLRQLMVIYGLSEILITNDSGPAHFAALTEIDVIALFGPETPALFAAEGPRSHPLWAGLACSPCVNAYNNRQTACRNNLCMQRITVEQVFATAAGIYRQRAGRV